MKRLIVAALLSALCVVSLAQNLRPVQGRVVNEDGAPLKGATITVKGYDATFTTDANGDFSAEIPYGYNYLTANLEDYFSKTVEVDGSYLIFKLAYDKDAVKRRLEAEAARVAAEVKAQKEAEAKAAVEEAARAKAEAARVAAEEKARKEAEAKAAAEEAARAKAEAARVAAEEKARKEAEAKAAAEEAARVAAEEKARKEAEAKAAAEEAARAKAEAARVAAEEKARKEAEAKAAAEEKARAKAEADSLAAEEAAKLKAEKESIANEKRAEKNAKDSAYNEIYKNRGLAHSIEFGYNPCHMTGSAIYLYSGWRDYTSFHPVHATYTISYKFNRTVSLGLGTGVLYNLKSCTIENDEFIPDENNSVAENFREKRMDVPVFINLRTSFCRTGVRPFINVNAGMYCLSTTLLADVGIGCEFRIARAFGMHMLAGVSFVPVPDFMFGGFNTNVGIFLPSFTNNGYECALTPSVKIGFDF